MAPTQAYMADTLRVMRDAAVSHRIPEGEPRFNGTRLHINLAGLYVWMFSDAAQRSRRLARNTSLGC